jgi:hypothetical protein
LRACRDAWMIRSRSSSEPLTCSTATSERTLSQQTSSLDLSIGHSCALRIID